MAQVTLAPSNPELITQGAAASPPGISSSVATLGTIPLPIQSTDVLLLYRNNLPYLLSISDLQTYLGVTAAPALPAYMPQNYINNNFLGRYL